VEENNVTKTARTPPWHASARGEVNLATPTWSSRATRSGHISVERCHAYVQQTAATVKNDPTRTSTKSVVPRRGGSEDAEKIELTQYEKVSFRTAADAEIEPCLAPAGTVIAAEPCEHLFFGESEDSDKSV